MTKKDEEEVDGDVEDDWYQINITPNQSNPTQSKKRLTLNLQTQQREERRRRREDLDFPLHGMGPVRSISSQFLHIQVIFSIQTKKKSNIQYFDQKKRRSNFQPT